jgi:hypothetical protein
MFELNFNIRFLLQSNPAMRDFRSPTKQVNPSGYLSPSHQQQHQQQQQQQQQQLRGGYFDEDDDSGADSLTDQPSCGSSCHQHHQTHRTSSSNLALVPFRDHHRQVIQCFVKKIVAQ